uniref:Uncharacterized protein n=1 Tax=Desertifilum tharense IPPAS B-1220 TaxID=1781255 RepID=A0ACD5GSQ9_9CYAN
MPYRIPIKGNWELGKKRMGGGNWELGVRSWGRKGWELGHL